MEPMVRNLGSCHQLSQRSKIGYLASDAAHFSGTYKEKIIQFVILSIYKNVSVPYIKAEI
jgi:hypothetical protein